MGLFWLILAGALIAVFGFTWMARPAMTRDIRRGAPGQFARLSDGVVHYQWHGPAAGPVLVLVHGLTTPSFVWSAILPGLTGAGFRVLTFDHFGRGYSDRPWRRYDHAFYRREIDDLLAALNIAGPVHWLGYSMGGAILADYAAHRRDRVDHAVLLAPAGFIEAAPSFATRWPVLGDALMYLLGPRRMRADARRAAEVEGTDAETLRLQIRETRFAGYPRAVLSSLRNVIYNDMTTTHEALRDQNVPLLTILAENDALIPLNTGARITAINPAAQVVQVPDTGHGLALTHPDQVVRPVLAFLPPPR